MTAFRLISLPTHGALEMLLGLTVMALPIVLGAGSAGVLTGVVVGSLAVGLALRAATADTAGIDVSAHQAFDIGLAIGLVGAALVLTTAAENVAALVLLVAGVAQLTLLATTRYSAR